MNSLIDLYDNALIYYPNIFLSLLGIFTILGLFFLLRVLFAFKKEFKRVVSEINTDLRRIKIKGIKTKKMPQIKFSLTDIFLILLKFIFKFIITIVSLINNFLTYIELQTKKIARKIGEEILTED